MNARNSGEHTVFFDLSKFFFFLPRPNILTFFVDFRLKTRRCASRDSTNQNASFVERFSRLERADFRGVCGEIFALFQACVGNFDTYRRLKLLEHLILIAVTLLLNILLS